MQTDSMIQTARRLILRRRGRGCTGGVVVTETAFRRRRATAPRRSYQPDLETQPWRIIPARTVALVVSSMAMKLPVERFTP